MMRPAFATALFSVIFLVTLIMMPDFSAAQNITGKTSVQENPVALGAASPTPTTNIIVTQPLTATLTIVSPVGGEKFVNGTRYPITWRLNVPKTSVPYKLSGEILLLDQNTDQAALKKDLRIGFLTEQDIAKGSYTFLAGAQQELTYGHNVAPKGKYKIWVHMKATYDCGPTAKCAPLFEAIQTLANNVTFDYR